MTKFTVNPDFAIHDETALRAMFKAPHDLAVRKEQDRLGHHAQALIKRAPFVCIGTQDAQGHADVSPRGDPAGFVAVLDDQTLAIPDRPGNNRLDSLVNITTNPNIGLLFIIPGFDETLRVNGQASLTTDPVVLARMTVQERLPKLAIIVSVQTVYIHCAKAFRRAHLWDPAHFQNRSEMPSLMKMVLDQTADAPRDPAVMQELEEALEESYKSTMY